MIIVLVVIVVTEVIVVVVINVVIVVIASYKMCLLDPLMGAIYIFSAIRVRAIQP